MKEEHGASATIEVALFAFPGRNFAWRHPSTRDNPDDALLNVLASVSELVDLEALLVGVRLSGRADVSMRVLRVVGIATPAFVGLPVVELPELTHESIARWIHDLTSVGEIASCELLAARYRVAWPEGVTLKVRNAGCAVVNDGLLDPRSAAPSTQPPFTFQYHDIDGGRLNVSIHWSSWCEDGAVAQAMRRWFDALERDGWLPQHSDRDRTTDGGADLARTSPPTEAAVACEGARLAEAQVEIEQRDREAAGSLVGENPGQFNIGGDRRAPVRRSAPTERMQSFDITVEDAGGTVSRSVEVTTIERPVSRPADVSPGVRHAIQKVDGRQNPPVPGDSSPIPGAHDAAVRIALATGSRNVGGRTFEMAGADAPASGGRPAVRRGDWRLIDADGVFRSRPDTSGNLFDDVAAQISELANHTHLDRVTLVDVTTGSVLAEYTRTGATWARVR
ncbi:MAG: hypothetical protein R3B06_30380 [Kofleriaceae bacterium]